MYCSFRGRRSTLDVSIVIFRGRRSTLDASCCAFFFSIALVGLRQLRTRCKFRGNRGILCDILKIDGHLGRNIDFEIANFQVLRKIHRKISVPFVIMPNGKIKGNLVRNINFSASTYLISSRWFSCGVAVFMREAKKYFLFEGVQAGCRRLSYRFAWRICHFVTFHSV